MLWQIGGLIMLDLDNEKTVDEQPQSSNNLNVPFKVKPRGKQGKVPIKKAIENLKRKILADQVC